MGGCVIAGGLCRFDLMSGKRNEGQRDVEVRFAGVTFRPGHYLYADVDGLVTSEKALR